MRKDHRPYFIKRWQAQWERFYVRWFLAPQFESMGAFPLVMKPWHVHLHGARISMGESVHLITDPQRPIRLTTWRHEQGQGAIHLGDYSLVCPGVRIDSAVGISVGANSMIAAGCYLTDADWHGVYDRTLPIGQHGPIELAPNVWLGDGVTVCKGVRIGENTIVGAGSVVTRSLPANVVAAGNPAAVVKPLDPDEPLTRRESLLAEGAALELAMQNLDRSLLAGNRLWYYLKTRIRPGPRD